MKKNYIIAIILCSLVFLGGMLLQNFLYPNSPETVNPAASSVSSTQETKTSTNEPVSGNGG